MTERVCVILLTVLVAELLLVYKLFTYAKKEGWLC